VVFEVRIGMRNSSSISSIPDDPADSCRTTLEGLGELQPDLVNNPKYVRKTLWVYAPLLGALGVLSGYTLYFRIEPILHGHGHEQVRTLVLELLLAAVMVAILEWVKGVIQNGIVAPVRSWRSVMSSLLTVRSLFAIILFELFVLAAHSLVDVTWVDIQQRIHDIWQGGWMDFVIFGLVWMISGAVLARQISKAIFARRATAKNQMWHGALRGVAAGLVAAAVVWASVAVLRVIWEVKMIVAEHDRWHSLLNQSRFSVPARALDYRLDSVHLLGLPIAFGWIILLAAAVLLAYSSWKSRNWKPFAVLATVTVLVLVPPVADANGWKLTVEVFFAWCVPGAVLGASMGILFKKTVHERWPVAAVAIAIIICLCTIPILLVLANKSGLLGDLNRLAPQGSFSDVILGNAIRPANQLTNPTPVDTKDEANDAILWQVCITGSLGFWVSVGLLIGGSVRETQERTSLYPDGKHRCFWVKWTSKGALEYHDILHGVLPKSDRELFTRLAVELLTGGTSQGYASVYGTAFENLDPETVARMSAAELRKYIRDTKSLKDVAWVRLSRVGAVVENAKRLQAFYDRQRVDSTLIRTLENNAETGSETAVRFFRSTFKVRDSFAVGSFLQATGFLPGAHFRGCWRYGRTSADELGAPTDVAS
jgi:3-methyladenine DNA glycosylase Tag